MLARLPSGHPGPIGWLGSVGLVTQNMELYYTRNNSACYLSRNSDLGNVPSELGIEGDTIQLVPSVSVDSTATDSTNCGLKICFRVHLAGYVEFILFVFP